MDADRRAAPLIIIVTGLSGAGRSTAINAFEDLGFETLDNFPLSLLEALVEPVSGSSRPIALGVETRTRGFSARALTAALDTLRRRWEAGGRLVFLDCSDAVLLARFSETRRRHPLAPAEDAATGIARERDILEEVRARADAVIDTTELTPHQLKAELERRFGGDGEAGLAVSVQSFSYKRGVPFEADMVIDCRFLRNPYWDEALRALDGSQARIQAFVGEDPLYAPFFDRLAEMVLMLLPAYRAEGKAYFTVALGCTGGRHRSVVVAERLGERLAEQNWTVRLRHRELERLRAGARTD
ncbi:MAG TPA: RNase adapter RapZ [Thermohalobaculum sp.]|nr:RNase adapter RapZ [Thermohalobaculum sp.]